MLLFSDSVFEQHETGPHPESPNRLRAIAQKLQELPAAQKAVRGQIRLATAGEIEAVHGVEYIRRLENVSALGGGMLDADTVMSARSLTVARLAAGTACEAVTQVVSGQAGTALCLTRPPGHHALPDQAMGFCLFNNIAIAARHAQNSCGLERILIVDWDVHHGNGTQEMFYEDGQVFFLSTHRFPFYPGSGDADETGTGAGLGATLNVPVSFGTPRSIYFDLFRSALDKCVQRCRPELILISAGFDAHRLDPIGSLGLETEDFGRLTEIVKEAAAAECQGRIVSLLEGGYHPQALADSVALHLENLSRE